MGRWDRAASNAAEVRAAERATEKQKAEAHVERQQQVVAQAACDLQAFLESEDGQSALRFLDASGKDITFGEQRSDEGTESAVSLYSYGITAFPSEIRFDRGGYNRYLPLDTREVMTKLEAAVTYYIEHGAGSGKDPRTIVSWLTSEVDRLADEVR